MKAEDGDKAYYFVENVVGIIEMCHLKDLGANQGGGDVAGRQLLNKGRWNVFLPGFILFLRMFFHLDAVLFWIIL